MRSLKVSVEVIALPGQRVLVKNFRVKAKDSWEEGIVTKVNIDVVTSTRANLSYSVLINGKNYHLTVGEDSIKLL